MLLILLAMAAVQGDPPGEPRRPGASIVIEKPHWRRMPSGRDLHKAVPRTAERAGVSGRATIQCEVVLDGLLDRCVVVEETPAGYGFGAAVLQLAPKFQMKPTLPDGRSVTGGSVRIPLTFRAPGDGP